jgi:Uma2 family endonuclease
MNITVAHYHRLIELGILTEDDRVELLEGNLVVKMAHDPPHDVAVQRLTKRLVRLAPPGWEVRIQSAITLADSEPEPDAVLARGDESTFAHRHPQPTDIGLIVEVSSSSLSIDRADKGRIYSQAGLPIYWIVNVIDRQIEVYTDPQPTDPEPKYATRSDYHLGDTVALTLDGSLIANFPVSELLG